MLESFSSLHVLIPNTATDPAPCLQHLSLLQSLVPAARGSRPRWGHCPGAGPRPLGGSRTPRWERALPRDCAGTAAPAPPAAGLGPKPPCLNPRICSGAWTKTSLPYPRICSRSQRFPHYRGAGGDNGSHLFKVFFPTLFCGDSRAGRILDVFLVSQFVFLEHLKYRRYKQAFPVSHLEGLGRALGEECGVHIVGHCWSRTRSPV